MQSFAVRMVSDHQFYTLAIEVAFYYLAESTPSGMFVIVHSLTNSSDVHYAVGERSDTRVIIDGLSGGVYNVVVYDRGEDQLPEEWPAASQTVRVNDDNSSNGKYIYQWAFSY